MYFQPVKASILPNFIYSNRPVFYLETSKNRSAIYKLKYQKTLAEKKYNSFRHGTIYQNLIITRVSCQQLWLNSILQTFLRFVRIYQVIGKKCILFHSIVGVIYKGEINLVWSERIPTCLLGDKQHLPFSISSNSYFADPKFVFTKPGPKIHFWEISQGSWWEIFDMTTTNNCTTSKIRSSRQRVHWNMGWIERRSTGRLWLASALFSNCSKLQLC